MYNVETARNIVSRAHKSLSRRVRDGKPFRPVQDPLVELAYQQIQVILDLESDNSILSAKISALSLENEAGDAINDANCRLLAEKQKEIDDLKLSILTAKAE